MRTAAIIPARGGSKGVPGKNIKLIAGKPLIAYTIEQAFASQSIERVFVSTDDQHIADVATKYGAEVVWRPASISGDTAPSESAVLHALDHLEQKEQFVPDLLCFLQCTSPIRGRNDIDDAIATLIAEQSDSLLTVSPSHRFLWRQSEAGAQAINYDFRARPRRQDMETQYVENGSFYLFRPSVIRKTGNRLGGKISLHIMSESASFEIDSLLDFKILETVLRENESDH